MEGQPELYGNVGLGYDIGGFSARLSLFYQSEYTSAYSADGKNDIVTSSLTRLDLSLKQQITSNFAVMVNVNNLTNTDEETLYKNRITGWKLLYTRTNYGLTADAAVTCNVLKQSFIQSSPGGYRNETTMVLFCCSRRSLLLSASVFGQNLTVPTLKASGKYLNEIIANDSVAAKAGNRTYVLQRDSIYYVNAVIRNIGWPLRMVAGTSGNYKPSVFFLLPTGLAQYPTQMFDVQGNIYMQNIQTSSINELSPSSISGMGQNLILTNAQGFDIVIDSCIFNQAGQGFIRTTSAPRVVKVTNAILADMGYIGDV